jgi:putative copper export protein
LLLSPSLTGHAAASAGEYRLVVLSDWLHLVAGGFWVGGLFHLALALPSALTGLTPERRAHALGRVITLFTRVAVPSVALVFLAGLYNSWIHVGGWKALWVTAYGKTLLVKLLLVLAMLVLGALNNFHYGRRVKRLAGGREASAVDGVGRGFARSLKLEAALGALVLLATAFLVFTMPGRNHTTETTPARAAGPAGAEQR